MPSGVPLTPAQVEILARVYEETSNASEAGRAAGVDVSTATAWVRKTRDRKRAHLHAQACQRGMRDGRRHLTASSAMLASLLAKEGADGIGMEPKDIAAIANALTNATKARVELAAALRQDAAARLTREKTRAETDLIRRRIEGTLPPENVTVTHDARDELASRFARLLRPDGVGAGDPPPDASGS